MAISAKTKSRNVIVSSVCPRLTSENTTQTIEAVNAGLVTLCRDKNAIFADSTPSFTLSDGSINDGYLLNDGVHVTHSAMNKIAKTMKLKIKHAASGVCVHTPTIQQSTRSHYDNKHAESEDWTTVRRHERKNQQIQHTIGAHASCFYCGENGHAMQNCRHGRKVQCHQCNGLGHKAKFCSR